MTRFQFSIALLVIGLLSLESEGKRSKARFLMRDRLDDDFPEFLENGTIPAYIMWHDVSGFKVVVSDYSSSADIRKQPFQRLKDQSIIYLAKSMCKFNLTNNMIVVDISAITLEELPDIIQVVHDTGADLAEHLIKMKQDRYISSWKNTQFFGLGIGAYVATVAANIILTKEKEKIERLTALDPFGPGFIDVSSQNSKNNLSSITKDVAEFVKIMHCNMGNAKTFEEAVKQGRYGSSVDTGHAIIYANGGEQMPTCKQEDETPDNLCSHRKCAAFLANSIRQEVAPLACPCDSWESFKAGKCKCTKENGGIDVSYKTSLQASGKYYADVPEALLVVK